MGNTEEATRALFERYLAAQRAKDIRALMTCWHDDAVGIHPMRPDRNWSGIDANERLWTGMWEQLPDARYEVVAMAMNDHQVFLEASIELPDGTMVPSVSVFEVDDGKFREVRVYTDVPTRDGVGIEELTLRRHAAGT